MKRILFAILFCLFMVGTVWADLNTGLVAYYPFNGNANDESGNGNHGTVNGGVNYTTGINGQGAIFDGVDDYIECEPTNYNPVTITAWVKCEHGGRGMDIAGTKRDNYADSNFGYCLQVWADGTMGLWWGNGPNSSQYVKAPYTSNQWHFIVGVLDDTTGKLYLDGEFKGSAVEPYSTNMPYFAMGAHYSDWSGDDDWNNFFNGQIDEVRVYNRALSASEIQELYTGTTATTNTKPSTPTLSSPSNDLSDVSLSPTLTAGSFSDPDIGDTHSKTDWQVSTSNSFSSNILSMQSTVHLTSLTVPDLTLEENTTYYWRVRFYDNNSNASDWSQTFSFTTEQTFTDINVNGIPDALENPTVDLDNDGTYDIQQTTIKSLNTVIGNGQMGVSVNSSATASAKISSDDPSFEFEAVKSEDASSSISIVRIDSIDPDTISEIATPSYMPLGLFSFKLFAANSGDEANVIVYFSEQAPATAKWLFYDSINGWSDYSEHATFSQDRMSVALELKDGSYGDSDGIANGVIVDPCGWGMASWLKGQVTDASTQRAVTNCSLIISELDLTIPTLSDGNFLSMILPGTYDILVSAPGYQSRTLSDVDIDEAEIVTQNISMSSNTGVKNVSITGTPTVGNQMTFSVENNSSDTTYYRFSMHPDYGTYAYEKGFWQSMTDTEYISQNSCNYSFNQSGKYIVVVWLASSTNPVVSGIPMLGWSVDVSDASCKTNFTGLEISGIQKVNTPVSFTVNAENACSSHLYYRFSMHADYGTDAYNTGAWQQMTTTEWVADNSIDYTFTKAGKYIVVVWVSDTNQNVNPTGIPIIGWSVDIE